MPPKRVGRVYDAGRALHQRLVLDLCSDRLVLVAIARQFAMCSIQLIPEILLYLLGTK